MKLRWIGSDGVSDHDVAKLPDLRMRTGGFLWLDIPEWSEEAEAILTDEFHFHQMAITESKTRSHVPRVHVYPDHDSSSCMHLRSARRATCTIWSWTSSSRTTFWSRCMAR